MSKKISRSDCVLNAAIQLASCEGDISTYVLEAKAAHAEAWLHLGEMLGPRGWADLDTLVAYVEDKHE